MHVFFIPLDTFRGIMDMLVAVKVLSRYSGCDKGPINKLSRVRRNPKDGRREARQDGNKQKQSGREKIRESVYHISTSDHGICTSWPPTFPHWLRSHP